jgi:CheY-like chemotaxis protein
VSAGLLKTSEESINILIVDDYPENLLALEAVLSSLEYNVFQALSGSEALDLVKKHQFCVVLLDIQMPVMDGFETAKLIRNSPDRKSVV